ncbi:MAG TPA: F0F1 ATP synthase subunit A [Longimicrobiaceae bacterium]|nr:F0F1 ATP synthase subunit A [Longimicrobiaceae bacterium]
MFATIALLAALVAAPQPAPAQTGSTPVVDRAVEVTHGVPAEQVKEDKLDLIEHISDSHEIATPWGAIHLPPAGSWQVGPVDMTPTRHVVFLGLAGIIVLLLIIPAAQSAKRTGHGTPRKGHNVIESLILFFRDQVVMPTIGHGGERYVPYIITLFFFIVVANLMGLLPWGVTPTANVSVTGALAILSLIVIEISGMIALGPMGYLKTIVYIPHGLPKFMIPIMVPIMIPVEVLGKLAKPFALAIRLFANMTAGHVVLLVLIGLIFVFGSFVIAVGPVLMAVALSFLEIFVAFLQAYIFALLTAVFIGLIRHAH